MPLGARELEVRMDFRPDSAWQLLAERAKDLFLSLAVRVHKYHKFVRRVSQSFEPRRLQELFGHFHV